MRLALLPLAAVLIPAVSLSAQARPAFAEWEGTIVIEHRFVYDEPDERTDDEDGLGFVFHFNRSIAEERFAVIKLRGGRVTAWISGDLEGKYDQTTYRWSCGGDDTPRRYSSTTMRSLGGIGTANGAVPVRVTLGPDGRYRIEATSPPERRRYPYVQNTTQEFRVEIPGDPPVDCQDAKLHELGGPYETETPGMLHAILSGQATPGATALIGWTSGSRGIKSRRPPRATDPTPDEIARIRNDDDLLAPLVPPTPTTPARPQDPDPTPPFEVEAGPDGLGRILLRGEDQSGQGPKPASLGGLIAPLTQGGWWRVTWHLTKRPECRTVQEAVDAMKAMRDRQLRAAEATEADRAALTGDSEAVVAERARLDARATALRGFAESLALDIAVEESELAGCRP